MYDVLPIDDLDRYRATGADIIRGTRFTGHDQAVRLAPDLIITTYTRPPDIGVPIVNAGSHARHLKGIAAPVTHLTPWSTHDVAAYTVSALCEHADPRKPVAVIGVGRIGRRVARWLRRNGWEVWLEHHHSVMPWGWDRLGAVTLHLADGQGWLEPFVEHLHEAVLVNTAYGPLIGRSAIERGLRRGYLSRVITDVGPTVDDRRVTVTPHIAWQGATSARLRPQYIEEALRARV